MASTIRSASAEWRGVLRDGSGTVSVESGAVSAQPYSFNSRFGSGVGGTNPEELLGAAHAGCFSMALANALGSAGHPATSVRTTARVHLEQVTGGFDIPRIALTTEVEVEGIDEADFQRIAAETKAGCPISKALRAVEITLDARRV